MEWTAVLALGFFLGMRHATDADHVLAVSTIVARQKSIRGATNIGMWWGVGHTLTILVVGAAIIVFEWVVPQWFGLSMEFSVGIMLVVLGSITVVGALRNVETALPGGTKSASASGAPGHQHTTAQQHSHTHVHGDYVHTHAHSHAPESHPHEPEQTPLARVDRRFGGMRSYRAIRPLVVGMVHGLAGSAAVTLLVLASIANPRWSVLYLVVFGFGTIAGMMLITAAIATPLAYTGGRSAGLNRGLRIACGILSVAFGAVLAYNIGVIDGLFIGV